MPKIGKVTFLAVVLLLYGGVCGFSPSIIRAVVLCLVSYIAKQFLSSVDFLETLGFSAIIILFLSPVDLFDVGFQLSFSACLGIALLQKRVGQVCVEIGKAYRKVFPKKLTEAQKSMVEKGDTLPKTLFEYITSGAASAFSVSLAAQIATAPIQLAHFGYISGWGLLLNVLFVPLISAGFAFLLLFAVIACLLPIGASSVVLYIPNVVWSAILLLFEVVDFSSFALVGWQVSAQAGICYYTGCVFATDKLYLSAVWKRIGGVACFLAFIFLFLLGNL
jgi:competence protein ComEC